jgi:hypothetical protein
MATVAEKESLELKAITESISSFWNLTQLELHSYQSHTWGKSILAHPFVFFHR